MDPLDSPFKFESDRNRIFLEAKHLVEEQFPFVPLEERMKLIGQIVIAHCSLFAADRVAEAMIALSSSVDTIAQAIKDHGDE